jgi:hypothetical protein
MLEHAFRAKHLQVVLAEELYLLILVDLALGGGTLTWRCPIPRRAVLPHRKGRENCIVDWQVLSHRMVSYFIKGTFDD